MKDSLLKRLGQLRMGLVVHLPTFVSTADLTEGLRTASVEETLNALVLAADLGAKKAVLHPSVHRGMSVFVMERAAGYALDSLAAFVEKADELGVRLCLENMFPQSNSLVEPSQFGPVFSMFPNLQMTLDIGHANIGGGGAERTIAFIEQYGPVIGHIHASDNSGRSDDHLPIGAGTVDWPRVAAALKQAGFDGTVTFEIFSRDQDYLMISRDKFAAMTASDETT
jgi:sugar phosphate isomerase/epimerase